MSYQNVNRMLGYGLINESYTDGIVAKASCNQANGVTLVSELNRLATVATAGDSVVLPASQPGYTIFVTNHGAAAAQVFGAGTDKINDIAAATGVSQMPNSTVLYTCYTAGNWYTEGLATGFSGGYQTLSAVNGLTALAGGAQAGTALTAMINRVTTVATAADSVQLPVSVAGMSIVAINAAAANAMNVFPATGEVINALAANTAISVAANKSITFYCAVAGTWNSQLSA